MPGQVAEALAVGGADAGALLAAVLQRVEPEEGQARGLGDAGWRSATTPHASRGVAQRRRLPRRVRSSPTSSMSSTIVITMIRRSPPCAPRRRAGTPCVTGRLRRRRSVATVAGDHGTALVLREQQHRIDGPSQVRSMGAPRLAEQRAFGERRRQAHRRRRPAPNVSSRSRSGRAAASPRRRSAARSKRGTDAVVGQYSLGAERVGGRRRAGQRSTRGRSRSARRSYASSSRPTMPTAGVGGIARPAVSL